MTGVAILERVLETVPPRLLAMQHVGAPAPAGHWSKKQILGHLIDSACNNHQRFVRSQLIGHLDFPNYAQNEWVSVQAYETESWPDLVNLWTLLNRHILHVVRNIPPERLANTCSVGGKEPMALCDLFDDYVEHMEHHLSQIFG
jgi:DinB superfamily